MIPYVSNVYTYGLREKIETYRLLQDSIYLEVLNHAEAGKNWSHYHEIQGGRGAGAPHTAGSATGRVMYT
jgi:hypothetical protein